MNIIKNLVPKPLKAAIRSYREEKECDQVEDGWKAVSASLANVENMSYQNNVLIVPTDPWTLIGAVGDDAMISASVGMVSKAGQNKDVYVLTGDEQANKVAKSIGLRPLELWPRKDFAESVLESIRENRVGSVVVLGADVLDGYYGAVIAAKLLVVADVAARMGARVTVLGFSFNAAPVLRLKKIFDGLHHGVFLHAREKVSEERFRAFSSHPVKLVADSAFMLEPDVQSQAAVELLKWADEARSRGRKVIGLNVHPMLIKGATNEQVKSIVECVVEAVAKVNKDNLGSVSWVLVPHDYRDALGDDTCLVPIYSALKARPDFEVRYISGKHRAATLKAMALSLDGVIAGRMHLVIASLGMGVPVFALKYQDKFEGLLGLFGVDLGMSMTADEIVHDWTDFANRLAKFVNDIDLLKERVRASLPEVKIASRENYAPILGKD